MIQSRGCKRYTLTLKQSLLFYIFFVFLRFLFYMCIYIYIFFFFFCFVFVFLFPCPGPSRRWKEKFPCSGILSVSWFPSVRFQQKIGGNSSEQHPGPPYPPQDTQSRQENQKQMIKHSGINREINILSSRKPKTFFCMIKHCIIRCGTLGISNTLFGFSSSFVCDFEFESLDFLS